MTSTSGSNHDQALCDFLCLANRSTYANAKAERSPSTQPGSSDYDFVNGKWRYHDVYFGGNAFAGLEQVSFENKPIWGASYFGHITDHQTSISSKTIYDFLRVALMREYNDVLPIRGPRSFTENDLTYDFQIEGDLSSFYGVEIIRQNDKLLYELRIAGGSLGN